jgi:hypothetical protein
MKNLAGFNRDFRFTQQKHICAAAKDKAPRKIQTLKTKQLNRKHL